jgi:spore maturation protein CgeB
VRVLLDSDIFPDSFGRNIAAAAERMGHSVRKVKDSFSDMHQSRYQRAFWSVTVRALPAVERRRHKNLVRAAREFDPDLILLTYGTVPPATVKEMRLASRAKIAVWYPDHLANLCRQYLLAAELDAWFFKDPYMVRVFRDKLGIDAHYLPEACNPLWHHRVELTPTDRQKYGCDLTTASQMYYYRAKMLEIFKDYDLKIWGKNYPSWLNSPLRDRWTGVYVAEEEKAKAFNSAKIVLNTMHYAEIEGVNCRLFEVSGCGAFQVADWKPALPELFEPEREIVTFRTWHELKEKVDYYLARPEERSRIADCAYARAHREHTYEIRLRKMFEILGLDGNAETPAVEARVEERSSR